MELTPVASSFVSTLINDMLDSVSNRIHMAWCVRDGHVLSTGSNKYLPKTSPRFGISSFHAEVVAVTNFMAKRFRGKSRRIKQFDLVVISMCRDPATGIPKPRASRPCKDCVEFLKRFPVRDVVYSTADGSVVRERINGMYGGRMCGARRMKIWRSRNPKTARPIPRI